MQSTSVLSLTVVLLAAAASHLASGQVSCSQCGTRGFQPVCASGQTYANSCYAQCNGATSYTFGYCGATGGTRGGYNPYYRGGYQYNYYNDYYNRAGNPYYGNYYNNYYRSGYQYNPYYRSGYQYNPYPYNSNYNRNSGAGNNCNCPNNYDPVCAYTPGSNTRNTYLNSCVASCLGARISNRGFC